MLLATSVACTRAPEPVALHGATMGTVWTVQVAALPRGTGADALQAGIEARLETVNAQMSTYREDSDISRFNRAAPGTAFEVPKDFARVLEAALALAEATAGAYDPTVAPLVDLWGFGPAPARRHPPDDAEIDEARARVGWQRLDYDAARALLLQPGGLHLDFSSIAKGYAVDLIAEHLESIGVEGYLVDIGGDLRARGQRADRRHWRVAIERPQPGMRAIHSIVEPVDMALATSGSYRNFFRDEGREYSHTIDPRTGRPITHALASVTVVHPSCMHADALATALNVLGPEDARAFALEHRLDVLLVTSGEDDFEEWMTPGFARWLVEDTR